MSLTPAQRAANLARIAQAAVALERSRLVPAELCTAQCIVESAWLSKAPGNNPFGIKAKPGQPSVEVTTTEFLTPAQLARVRAAGRRILSATAVPGGKLRVVLVDSFAAFPSLEDSFAAYGDLLIQGRHFRARFARYLQHRSVEQLLAEMSGADGQPPYATDPNYFSTVRSLMQQANVRAALAAARSAVPVTSPGTS